MIVTTVHVWVLKEHIDDFIRVTLDNHENSIKEPGNMRFDILQQEADSSRFLLYEAYESAEAVAAHKKTPHYLRWKEQVEPWMERSREGVRHKVLAPAHRSLW